MNELNTYQVYAIKSKSKYKNDYCNVGAEDVKQFLIEQGIKVGNRKLKETLLEMIWADKELTTIYCNKFRKDYFCHVYDLMDCYGLTFDQAQMVAQSGHIEVTEFTNKKGYPIYTLEALKFTDDEMDIIIKELDEPCVVRSRFDVKNREAGNKLIEELGNIYEVQNISFYDKRDNAGIHMYCILIKKDIVSDIHTQSETNRLNTELANLNHKYDDLKKSHDNNVRGIRESDIYRELRKKYVELNYEHTILKSRIDIADEEG